MAKLTEEQRELNNLIRETNRLLEKTEDYYKTISSEVKAQKEIRDSVNDSIEQLKTRTNQAISLSQKYNTVLEATSEYYTNNINLVDKEIQSLETQVATIKEKMENLEEEGRLSKTIRDNSEKTLEALESQKKEAQKALDAQKKQAAVANTRKRSADQIKAIMEQTAAQVGLAADYSNTWVGSLTSGLLNVRGIDAALTQGFNTLRSIINPANLFAGLMDATVKSTMQMVGAMDQTFADFNRVTAAGGAYEQQIDDIRLQSLDMGVGMQRSAEAMAALVTTMRDFDQLAPEIQNELALSTAELERLGIGTTDTAQTLNVLTNAFQMTAEEAIGTQKRVAALATQLGIPPQEMATAYRSALPAIAQFGDRATDVFEDLAAQAKATGIAVNDLVSFTDKFETFEGAAESAGKLNAMLGGNLINSIDLLTAEGPEKIDLIRQALEDSGQSFADLDRFAKRSIAGIVGLPVDQAMSVFGTTNEEIERMKNLADGSTEAVSDLARRAQEATSAQEKWNLSMELFTQAAMPVLDVLTAVIDGVLYLNNATGGTLIPILTALTGAFVIVPQILSAVAAAFNVASAAAAAFGIASSAALWWLIPLIAAVGAGLYWLAGGFDSAGKSANSISGGGAAGFTGGGSPNVSSGFMENTSVEKLSQTTTVFEREQARGSAPQQNQFASRELQGAGSGKREVVLKINDRELGRTVVDLFNEKADLGIAGA
jgi:hypothetical protein